MGLVSRGLAAIPRIASRGIEPIISKCRVRIDLRALKLATFQEMMGLVCEAMASRYMETAWQTVEYLHDHHLQIFLGMGILYERSDRPGGDRRDGRAIAEIDLAASLCHGLPARAQEAGSGSGASHLLGDVAVYEVLRERLESVCQMDKGRIGLAGRLLA